MPLFTIKEIEIHRKSSGKISSLSIIVKTLNPFRKFKEERSGRNVLSFTRIKRITFYNFPCVIRIHYN